ncbi:hypothetical protein [Brasilonema sp. UFV-L1]|uniref:hypothetical protein n=1 Tax=Brasilonema sp. UFV-L1 TaxID=2234130 RepID=UPI00145D0736|nr:hypothetical protein [Brasilonema sp. UFV-L1]
MSNQARSIPSVDLVIVIDTSPSMKDEAQALSNAAAGAIAKAKSSCPSDLRVVWLGIEGTWKGTNFDQTLRAYLTQKKVPESKLRSRKKGQVADAGAQEDAARAIEDISDYFDWREGASRAIFYLGDEALEGGGDKTEQEDIKAANLAIQKAQAVGVTVHTYFGTSKSKNQESIKTEYKRLATSTGGQSFTNKDAISGFSGVLEKVICGSRTAKTIKLKPGAVYIQDCVSNELSKLYTLDLARGKATFIGEIVTEVSDIAFVGFQLYGLDQEGDKTQLVKIDLNSGDATVVGDVGFTCAGLAYNRQRQILYATTAKQLIAINLKTGKGTPVVTVADKDYNCGEVAFDANGKAYITLIGYDKKKLLASCNLDTGEVNTIGDTGFAALASMEFVGDVLYGVTGNFFNLGKDGQLIRIDTTTGKGTLVATTDPIGRWAGMTLYEPATVVTTETTSQVNSTVVTTQTTSQVNSDEKSEKANISQEIKAINEEGMSILTIDSKNNCYVIDPNQMNNLQQKVANSYTFDKGTFEIRITGGRYKYAKAKTEGEPFVLLWIYGVDGSTFINQNTGFEIGATWTTLNGYNDSLKLEVKQRTVLNALFFDVNNNDNSGSIDLLITSKKPFFNPHILTVDSKRNSYVLDESYLSSLKQSGGNFVELNPGNYRIKIREGNASYWSDNKKFNIEPWALIWVKGGKFITKLTGIETEESWSSLNGLKDEVVLEVKEKTTLTGLFFDTYKENNEGQIILAIEPVSATELTEKKKQKTTTTETVTTRTVTNQQPTTTTETVTTIQGTGGSVSREPVGANSSTETVTTIQGSGSVSPETVGVNKFTLQINEAEYKKKLEDRLQQISASFKVVDENDAGLEAKYWDQLEHWLLKNYEKHFKNLAIEVEKVRYTMDAYVEQMEFSVTQHLQDWSSYIDRFVQQKINVEISNRINQQINQYFNQTFEQKIRDNIGLIVNNLLNKQELNQYIDRHVDRQIDQIFDQKIRNNIGLIVNNVVRKQELNQYIDQHVDGQIDRSFEQKIRNNVELIINNLVNKQELNRYIDRHVDGQIDQTFEQKVRNNINLITQNIVNNNTELDQYVSQQIDNTYEQKLQNHISAITRNIVNNNEQLNQYFDQRLQHSVTNNTEVNNRIVNFVANSTEINNKISNLRNEWNQAFISLATQHGDELSNIIGGRETFNRLITQNLVNNNQELNQYFDQRLQHSVTDNTEVNNRILNFVANSPEINNKISNLRNEWNQAFISLVTQHGDELSNIIGGTETFNRVMTQKIVNNNTDIDQYVSQQIDNTYEQKIQNHIKAITQNIVNNNEELNQYFDQRLQHSVTDNTEVNNQILNFVANSPEINNKISNLRNEWNQAFISLVTQHGDELSNIIGGTDTFNRVITQKIVNNNTDIDHYVSQQIDNTYEQKIQNHIKAITQNIVNNNEELNQYFDQRLQHSVTNNTDVNNQILNFVANSTEINDKISNLRNEWNQAFISLATQHGDELSNVIGGTDTFNRVMTQKIVNNNTDIDQYVSQQIDNTYEQKIQNHIKAITQNIVNNNEELNQYFDQRLQHSVTNNTDVNNQILNFVANSTEINDKISNLRNEWNQAFISLATQHVNELSNILGGTDTFNRLIIQKIVNNNTDIDHYVSQQIDNTYEQKIQNHIKAITQNIVNNNEELNQYIDRRLQHTVNNNTEVNNEIVNLVTNSTGINNKISNLRNEWNQTFINLVRQHVDELSNILGGTDTFNRLIIQKIVNNNTDIDHYVSQQIDNTYEQKVRNYISVITQNIVNNNEGLNQYIDRRVQQNVTNNVDINNEIVNLVTNSTEINNKINNVYRDIDIKIDSIRNEWNQTFIGLVRQYVDQVINIIGDADTFNNRVANIINVKVDELLNQIIRTKNELTVLMNNSDRQLYEWTLGELMAIKGCLTDREVLVEMLVTFSAELRTKLDGTTCVDIKTIKPFKPISIDQKQQPQQLPGS